MIDMHIHTNASDGEYSIEKIIEITKELDYLAITDHDTVDGLKDIKDKKIIKGIEISCSDNDYDKIHIVGLGIDDKNIELNNTLNKLKQIKEKRAKEYIKLFNEVGFKFTYKEIKEMFPKGALRKNHFAKFFLNRKFINEEQILFTNYFNTKKFTLPKIKDDLLPKKAIELIHKAGGIAILAHPQKIKNVNIKDKITELKTYGLDGLEVFHSDMTKEDNIIYNDIAEEYCLLKSVGSDFHGPNVYRNENKQAGTGINNNIIVEEGFYRPLLNRLFNYIDLHIHTNESDGKLDINEVLKIAKNNGCKTISITDHNTINAYTKISDELDLEIIKGVEIDCDYTSHYDNTIHILGYNFNTKKMEKYLNKINNRNIKNIKKYIEIFKKDINENISYEEFDEMYKDSKVRSIERLFKYLIKKNYINSKEEILTKYKIISNYDTLENVVKYIKNCDGIAVLAHPWRYENIYGYSKKEIENIILSLKKVGLDGIEAYYSQNNEEQTKHWVIFAKENNLITTVGSDFHRIAEENRVNKIEIGLGTNNNLRIKDKEIIASMI